MGEVKWIKIYTNMINNKKVKRIRKMPEGNNIILIWVFLIAQAGECNSDGALFLSEAIPFSPEDLAIEFDFSLDTTKLALMILEKFGMIEVFDSIIYIKNWNEYQNVTGMNNLRAKSDAERAKAYRDRQKLKKAQLLLESADKITSRDERHEIVTSSRDAITTEEEEEEEKDIDIEYSSSSSENDIGKIITLLKDGQFKLPTEKYLNKWVADWLESFDITTIEGIIEEAITHNKTESLAYIKTIIKARREPSGQNDSTVKKPRTHFKDTEKKKTFPNKYDNFYL